MNCFTDTIGDIATNLGYIPESKREQLVNTIQCKHIHFNESHKGAGEAFRKESQVTSHQVGVRGAMEMGDITAKKQNKAFAKKLKSDCEGASIMVGAVDFLEKPLFMFLRQNNDIPAVPAMNLTEVSVNLKYIVVILGPLSRISLMRDAGRVMGSALTDEIFQVVAKTATCAADLITGLKNFSDYSTVLAPGQWNPTVRLDPPKSTGSQDDRKQLIDYEAEIERELGSPLLDKPAISPYAPHLPDGLQFSGRLFGGLIKDVKRKLPFYVSDFTDGLSVQCIAAVLFLFFIILTQMVSFGGLMGEATGNNIAAFETLVSASVNGVLWHLFSGQPLNIINSTGPVLVFERLLYNLCGYVLLQICLFVYKFIKTFHLFRMWGFAFLEFRFWVGMWMALMMLVIVAFDLSFLVCFITRFTEDNFAALIAAIYIYESFKSIFKLYKQAPVDFNPPNDYSCACEWKNDSLAEYMQANESSMGVESLGWTQRTLKPMMTSTIVPAMNFTAEIIPDCPSLNKTTCALWEHCESVGTGCTVSEPVPDVFLFSCLLFLMTFLIASYLKQFRFEPYFPRRVRVNISDFAVSITVFSMVAVDYFCGLPTAKLLVPKEFRPTNPDRPWLAPIFQDNPFWSVFAAAPLGFLACVLLFMDQQITTVIVNRKENQLKKGFGYHLDLLVVTISIIIGSVFGVTWLVAATVLAIGHMTSLRVESEEAAPGEPPKFLGLREQRLTGVCIFLMIGLSILARDMLSLIPMAVLYGCFLYMGVNVLKSCGNFQRLLLLIIPRKYQPKDAPYLQHVRLPRVHLFTVVQVISFACLWGLKEVQSVSMLFPMMVKNNFICRLN